MSRGDLTDAEWRILNPLLPNRGERGPALADNRRTVNGVQWVLRTGAPWRDLPPAMGRWQTVSSRFYRWRQQGVWARVLAALQAQADARGDLDWLVHYLDSTVIRAHQHAAGAQGGTQ